MILSGFNTRKAIDKFCKYSFLFYPVVNSLAAIQILLRSIQISGYSDTSAKYPDRVGAIVFTWFSHDSSCDSAPSKIIFKKNSARFNRKICPVKQFFKILNGILQNFSNSLTRHSVYHTLLIKNIYKNKVLTFLAPRLKAIR